jgi:hypothetical protein
MEQERTALDDRQAVARLGWWFGCSGADLIHGVWKFAPHPADVNRFSWMTASPDLPHVAT